MRVPARAPGKAQRPRSRNQLSGQEESIPEINTPVRSARHAAGKTRIRRLPERKTLPQKLPGKRKDVADCFRNSADPALSQSNTNHTLNTELFCYSTAVPVVIADAPD